MTGEAVQRVASGLAMAALQETLDRGQSISIPSLGIAIEPEGAKMQAQETERFEGWCVVEIMGHQTFAGYVSERAIAGAGMLQVDVPHVDEQHPAFTKLFGAAAIYAITPTTETHAREAAAQIRVRPLTLYILPDSRRLPVRVAEHDVDPDEEYERDRDDDWADEDE